MKRLCTLLFLAAITASCTKKTNEIRTFDPNNDQSLSGTSSVSQFRYSGSDYSQPISIATANDMISSYLNSIDYQNNTTTLRSLTFDADSMRAYLNDTTNGHIVTIKFMLAHREEYIAADNYGVNAGLNANALTMVIVGLNENDEYIYNNKNMVYDHARPCPANCGNSGNLLSY